MKKMIYIAEESRLHGSGDINELLATFDLETARKALADTHYHLTARERMNTRLTVSGYTIEAVSEDAEESWREYVLDIGFPGDPEFFEEFEAGKN